MTGTSTSFVGPLGSTIYRLRADAATVAALAGLDWTSRFRRVWLDPVGGVVVLMSPSPRHEGLTGVFDDIVRAAAGVLGRASAKLRSVRLRGKDAPPGTGMEPDCSFYVGERARAYVEALAESREAADAFLAENGPDLVVEVEITHADEGKIVRYADLGVREFWRLRGQRGGETLSADFLALGRGAAPRPLEASAVLPGLTPSDVCEAVEGVQLSLDPREGIEAVARIVRRRRRESFRVREERAPYGAPPPAGGAVPPPERTSFVGPLGSTIYRLRADAATVAALAGLDWTSRFRRVWLDPAREVVVLMSPSRLHERLGVVLDDIVDCAAEALGRATAKFGNVRLRGEGDPPGTGPEPDCCFHVGERAEAYLRAEAESEEAAQAFLEQNGPDLVVEVEITHADEGKIARYADLGVREFWRLSGKRGEKMLRADFLALGRGAPPRPLEASAVLPGLTPSDACRAVEGVRRSPGPRQRMETVAGIVRRRRQRSARLREELAPCGDAPADGEPAAAAVGAIPLEGPGAEDP